MVVVVVNDDDIICNGDCTNEDNRLNKITVKAVVNTSQMQVYNMDNSMTCIVNGRNRRIKR